MSNSLLDTLVVKLPDNLKFKVIFDYLHGLKKDDNLLLAEQLVSEIAKLSADNDNLAKSISRIMACYIQRSDLDKAITFYKKLDEFEESQEILVTRTFAMQSLVKALTPKQVCAAYVIWAKLAEKKLPLQAKNVCAYMGLFLLKRSKANFELAEKIYSCLNSNFSSDPNCLRIIKESQIIFARYRESLHQERK